MGLTSAAREWCRGTRARVLGLLFKLHKNLGKVPACEFLRLLSKLHKNLGKVPSREFWQSQNSLA